MEKRFAPEIIEEAFNDIQFENREEVEAAAEIIRKNPEGFKIDDCRVIDWLEEKAADWHADEILPGVKNIEEVFSEAEFSLEFLVEAFFGDMDNWSRYSDEELLEEFKALTGREVTPDEVVKNLDLDTIRSTVSGDIGIMGIITFLYDNGGDTEEFLKRLVEIVDDLSNEEIDEIVAMFTYIELGSKDAEKLYERVDWDHVKANDELTEYLEFFRVFAPDLNIEV